MFLIYEWEIYIIYCCSLHRLMILCVLGKSELKLDWPFPINWTLLWDREFKLLFGLWSLALRFFTFALVIFFGLECWFIFTFNFSVFTSWKACFMLKYLQAFCTVPEVLLDGCQGLHPKWSKIKWTFWKIFVGRGMEVNAKMCFHNDNINALHLYHSFS